MLIPRTITRLTPVLIPVNGKVDSVTKKNTLLKLVAFNIDPEVASRFEKFCAKHAGDPKASLAEFALDWVSRLSDSDFRRLYEPFYQWRSMRKREIKLEMAKQRDDGKGKK